MSLPDDKRVDLVADARSTITDGDGDGDGVSDVDERAAGTDPADPYDTPIDLNSLPDSHPEPVVPVAPTPSEANRAFWEEHYTAEKTADGSIVIKPTHSYDTPGKAEDPNGLDFEKDTDGDGLTDVDELTRWRTDPNAKDTDRDGRPDGDEVEQGFDPVLPNPPNATRDDRDGDGVSDLDELKYPGSTTPDIDAGALVGGSDKERYAGVKKEIYDQRKTGDPIGDAALREQIGVPPTPEEDDDLIRAIGDSMVDPNPHVRLRGEQALADFDPDKVDPKAQAESDDAYSREVNKAVEDALTSKDPTEALHASRHLQLMGQGDSPVVDELTRHAQGLGVAERERLINDPTTPIEDLMGVYRQDGLGMLPPLDDETRGRLDARFDELVSERQRPAGFAPDQPGLGQGAPAPGQIPGVPSAPLGPGREGGLALKVPGDSGFDVPTTPGTPAPGFGPGNQGGPGEGGMLNASPGRGGSGTGGGQGAGQGAGSGEQSRQGQGPGGGVDLADRRPEGAPAGSGSGGGSPAPGGRQTEPGGSAGQSSQGRGSGLGSEIDSALGNLGSGTASQPDVTAAGSRTDNQPAAGSGLSIGGVGTQNNGIGNSPSGGGAQPRDSNNGSSEPGRLSFEEDDGEGYSQVAVNHVGSTVHNTSPGGTYVATPGILAHQKEDAAKQVEKDKAEKEEAEKEDAEKEKAEEDGAEAEVGGEGRTSGEADTTRWFDAGRFENFVQSGSGGLDRRITNTGDPNQAVEGPDMSSPVGDPDAFGEPRVSEGADTSGVWRDPAPMVGSNTTPGPQVSTPEVDPSTLGPDPYGGSDEGGGDLRMTQEAGGGIDASQGAGLGRGGPEVVDLTPVNSLPTIDLGVGTVQGQPNTLTGLEFAVDDDFDTDASFTPGLEMNANTVDAIEVYGVQTLTPSSSIDAELVSMAPVVDVNELQIAYEVDVTGDYTSDFAPIDEGLLPEAHDWTDDDTSWDPG